MDSPSTPATPVTPPSLLEGRFGGRTEFAELIRQAFVAASLQGWNEIILCDPDFDDWPLGERVVAQALNDWSRSGRKLTMLARNYDGITRRHARFVPGGESGRISLCAVRAVPGLSTFCPVPCGLLAGHSSDWIWCEAAESQVAR